MVVADDDGVVVVPRGSAEAAETQRRLAKTTEASKRERLAGGELGLDMYNMRPRLEEAGLVYLDSLSDLG